MKSFEPGVLERQTVPVGLLGTIRRLGEYRVRQDDVERRPATVIDRLRDAVLRDSLDTSAPGDVPLPPGRLADLLAGRSLPDTRSEQEACGYRDVLRALPSDLALADFTPSVVLDLHARLFRHVPEGGGIWKSSDDLVTETLPDGSSSVVFTPVPAYGVEDAMTRLHERFSAAARAGTIDALLLVPSYLLDFVCIHPFADGNARVARLLARVLLRAAGYRVGDFVSLDALFARTRPQLSAALQSSWRGWHAGRHELAAWWACFLGLVLEAYECFERAAGSPPLPRGAKDAMVAEAVRRLPHDFRYADLERLVPAVSRPTINRALRRLRASRLVACVRPGRNARWQRLAE